MLEAFLRNLRQPEYIHVLINPLPFYGLAIAFVGLIVALFFRSRAAQVTSLVLITITAASAWPVAHYGEAAYDRVLSMADEDGQAWLEAHADRAERFVYVFYGLALVSAAAILIPKKWPQAATPLAIVTLVLTAMSLTAGGYISHAGGKIRHREFRNERPPPKKAEAEEHA